MNSTARSKIGGIGNRCGKPGHVHIRAVQRPSSRVEGTGGTGQNIGLRNDRGYSATKPAQNGEQLDEDWKGPFRSEKHVRIISENFGLSVNANYLP